MRTLTAIPLPTLTLKTISILGLVCLIAPFSLFVHGCRPEAPQPNTKQQRQPWTSVMGRSCQQRVWGDLIVYFPKLSTRCVSRWGNYNHSRRATVNAAEWIGAGYTNEKNSSGSNIVIPHYIRFGR